MVLVIIFWLALVGVFIGALEENARRNAGADGPAPSDRKGTGHEG
ncbi:hypothetical protein SAMN04244548_02976 [Paracoccus pantotrophus]|nr:hypothetical protein SAMN04244548_02976 [Paracoccus pantotrophus]